MDARWHPHLLLKQLQSNERERERERDQEHFQYYLQTDLNQSVNTAKHPQFFCIKTFRGSGLRLKEP